MSIFNDPKVMNLINIQAPTQELRNEMDILSKQNKVVCKLLLESENVNTELRNENKQMKKTVAEIISEEVNFFNENKELRKTIMELQKKNKLDGRAQSGRLDDTSRQ